MKVAGARNYFLKGDGAKLQRAVLQLALDRLTSKGMIEMEPPHLVLYDAMMGTGYFPGGEEQALFTGWSEMKKFLIGTSEVPVASYHMNEILDLKESTKTLLWLFSML